MYQNRDILDLWGNIGPYRPFPVAQLSDEPNKTLTENQTVIDRVKEESIHPNFVIDTCCEGDCYFRESKYD